VKAGAWHQFGDRSQKLALEQLGQNVGAGVIVSPRDLTRELAVEYATSYRALGAEVLADPQFYIPDSETGHLSTHETAKFRHSVGGLGGISPGKLAELGDALASWNSDLKASAVIAPAVIYEAGRPDIVDINASLFSEARVAAKVLGIPVYATAVLGHSVTSSDVTLAEMLSAITALDPDGWYFSFEFRETRIPSSSTLIQRFLEAGLTFACTGKPVLHAYAGPLVLLSRCCGVTAAGIGHSQNTWQFTRDRWQPSEGGGGGGAAPARMFCPKLWGTIVYEDEFALLPTALRTEIYAASPFSSQITVSPPFLPWSKWDANKHLVHTLCTEGSKFLAEPSIRKAAALAAGRLQKAIALHGEIAAQGVKLTDNTASYQGPWLAALQKYLAGSEQQISFFELL
jgi:hypothetical protein